MNVISVGAIALLAVVVLGSIAAMAWTMRGQASERADRSRSGGGFVPLVVVILVVLVVFGLYFSRVHQQTAIREMAMAERAIAEAKAEELSERSELDRSTLPASPPSETKPGIEEGPVLPEESEPSGETLPPAPPPRPKSRVLSPAPDWTQDEELSPSAETIVVSGSLATSRPEAEKDAYDEARRQVIRYFDRHRAQQTVLPKKNWTLTDVELRNTVVRKTGYEEREHDFGAYQARMYRAYLQLELSPDTLDEIEPIWRRQAAQGRLVVVAIGLGLITAFVAGSHVLLRVTGRRREGREL